MTANITSILTLTVAVLTFLTSISTLVKSWLEIKKLKKSLEHIQIVANPREMKEALIRPLEGLWKISGVFEKYQGSDIMHYSSGYANFWWNDSLNRYTVVYSYSVSQAHQNTDCVTAICYGYALEGNSESPKSIVLKMQIENRTSEKKLTAPISREFTLETTLKTDINKSLRELSFPFKTDITSGVITFSR